MSEMHFGKLTTYRYTVSGVGCTSQVSEFPDFLRHYAYVIIFLQVEVRLSSRGVADNADVSLVGADLDSVDDVHDELFDHEPVEGSSSAGRVEYNDDVTATVAVHCD